MPTEGAPLVIMTENKKMSKVNGRSFSLCFHSTGESRKETLEPRDRETLYTLELLAIPKHRHEHWSQAEGAVSSPLFVTPPRSEVRRIHNHQIVNNGRGLRERHLNGSFRVGLCSCYPCVLVGLILKTVGCPSSSEDNGHPPTSSGRSPPREPQPPPEKSESHETSCDRFLWQIIN